MQLLNGVVWDKSAPIPGSLLSPHYTNPQFKNSARTVYADSSCRVKSGEFGTEFVDEASAYAYSDRILQWWPEREEGARKAAEESGLQQGSAARLEVYLRHMFDDPKLELLHILTGVNLSDGYPYRVYGYRTSEE